MSNFPKIDINKTHNLQKIAVRMIDGNKKIFYNADGWNTYNEIQKELSSVKNIKALLVDVTGLKK